MILPFTISIHLQQPTYHIPSTKYTHMNNRNPPPILFLSKLIIISYLQLFFSDQILVSSINEDQYYQNCGNTFNCGTAVTDIGYPFRSSTDPSYCGYPGLVLNCDAENNTTSITIANQIYIVLEISSSTQTMKITKPDLDICTSQLVNSTLDFSLFDYSPDNINLTFIYGCSVLNNLLSLNSVNCGTSVVYVSNGVQGFGNCGTSVIYPVFQNITGLVGGSVNTINQVLREGFKIKWKVDITSVCSKCINWKGRCGYDSVAVQTGCFCPDPPYLTNNTICFVPPTGNAMYPGPAPPGSKRDTKTNIVLPIIGAVLAGILFGWIVFFCRQRRKRLALVSKQLSIDTKELPTTPLTKKESNTSPSIAFTKSIPSYPSMKSDFGRNSSYFGAKMFTYNELVAATENFAEARELGDGGFGAVYHGTLPDGCTVAVKRLYENNYKRVEQFMNEIEILTKLRHSNLVTLFGCTSKESRELLLVYEYIPNGTVADHLHGKLAKSGLLTWPVRLNIAIETARALAYLHSSDIIHRDVKTTNILLDNDCHVKVADFGLCRLFPINATHVTTAPQGTPGYVDPDYHQCYQLTEKSDVYSFGVVLIELISSLPAVDTNRHRHDINLSNMAIDRIQNHRLHELVDPKLQFETNSSIKRMITSVAELAFRCLQQEKDMRPSMQEVLDNLIALKVEVVTIVVDDSALLLKGNNSPLSPDTVMAKWDSGSTMVSYG